ncbi:hypothetical protein D1007_27072 [Hordeum vulgare]|nr:hypothetical protein D1007_27072 [Hordeum vulgare]
MTVPVRPPRDRLNLANIRSEATGRIVLVQGFAQAIKKVRKNLTIIILREGLTSIKCVLDGDDHGISNDMVCFVRKLKKESFVEVEGVIEMIHGSEQMRVRKLYCVDESSGLPFHLEDAARGAHEECDKKGKRLAHVSLSVRLNWRFFDLRVRATQAVFWIQSEVTTVIDFVDSLFVDIFDHLAKNCSEMLDMIQEQYPCERLKYLQQNVRLKYSEGIEMLQESGFPIQEPQDLNNKAELMLGKLVLQKYKTDFFILYEYPLALRPFYTMPSAEKRQPGSYSNSFDAFIRGQEVLSGSQRIHDKSLLIKMIDERGYNKTTFQQFSNTFGCGAPPRGGFGVGLERLVMLYLGVPDFRIASLFPRDPGRLAP